MKMRILHTGKDNIDNEQEELLNKSNQINETRSEWCDW